jgi:hypothetical protein
MRLTLWLVLASALFSPSAQAVELKYVWKKGDVLRYRYEEVTHFKDPGIDRIVTVRSIFSERVVSVARDGRAKLQVTIEKLELGDGSQAIAPVEPLPPSARVLTGQIDRRGHLTLDRMATVVLRDGRLEVAVRDGAPNAHERAIDVVPRRLLALLALPAADQKPPQVAPDVVVDGTVATLRLRNASADLTSRFDTVAGRLLEVRGTLMMRLATKINSVVVLTHLGVP